jgi:23S rRNA (cytosine1962-C5)-methyltransferase
MLLRLRMAAPRHVRGDGVARRPDDLPIALRPSPLAVAEARGLPIAEVDTPARHPLVYAKRVLHVDRGTKPGATVAVLHEGQLVGFAAFNPWAEIRLRMLRHGSLPPDEAYWRDLLGRAADLRTSTLKLDARTNAYRVLNAEADGVSGLMVDRFGPVLAAEVFALGMRQRVEEILAILAERLGTTHTVIKCGPATVAQEGFETPPVLSPGAPAEVLIQEQGTKYRVRFAGGHKTGFFCDQRHQRQRLAELVGGRSVLDLCCYTGGFAVAAKGGKSSAWTSTRTRWRSPRATPT